MLDLFVGEKGHPCRDSNLAGVDRAQDGLLGDPSQFYFGFLSASALYRQRTRFFGFSTWVLPGVGDPGGDFIVLHQSPMQTRKPPGGTLHQV